MQGSFSGEKQADKDEWLSVKGELIKVSQWYQEIGIDPKVGDSTEIRSNPERINYLGTTWNKVKSSLKYGLISPVPEDETTKFLWLN